MKQLLWARDGPCFDKSKLPNKPSWSWTATESAKVWPPRVVHPVSSDHPETTPKELTITPQGYLQILGYLGTVKVNSTYIHDDNTTFEIRETKSKSLNGLGIDRNFHVLTRGMNDSLDQSSLGLVNFDNDETTSYSHACFLGAWASRISIQEPIFGNIVRISL
jgi:hypothetical protein